MRKNEFIEGGIQKIQGIMVSKNAPAWKAFRFISGAKSKDETRFFMTGIHIERAGDKTILVATDGRRLHIATVDTVDIEPGDYQVKENTRDFMILYPMDNDIQYPNWKRIVKTLETQKRVKIDLAGTKNKADFSRSLYQLFQATGAAVNIEHLEPLAGREWDVYFSEKEKAHTFVAENLIAIIMPMQEVGRVTVDESAPKPEFRDITPEPKVLEFKPAKTAKGKKRKTA
jgi:DNA polymerase III sliding clamp (beta) subunit (PCNA family)